LATRATNAPIPPQNSPALSGDIPYQLRYTPLLPGTHVTLHITRPRAEF
jgi:hypothetical protein